jgi:hypothetical protein
MRIRIRDLAKHGSGIRDLKNRTRGPGLTSRIRNSASQCETCFRNVPEYKFFLRCALRRLNHFYILGIVLVTYFESH